MANPNDHQGSKDKASGGKDHMNDPHKVGQKQQSQTGGDQRQQSGTGVHNDPKKGHDADHKGGQR